jgi:hypothetical protein
MKAPSLLALSASVAFNVAGLIALAPRAEHFALEAVSSRAAEINGLKVIDLAPVEVHPSAQDLRDAGLAAAGAAVGVLPALARRAGLIGAQLSMPYYSFGTEFGHIGKE